MELTKEKQQIIEDKLKLLSISDLKVIVDYANYQYKSSKEKIDEDYFKLMFVLSSIELEIKISEIFTIKNETNK